jgi:DNA-binding LacI/PurR family transcriptional regulator
MTTIRDVAEKAGVSISTVSRVFSGNIVVKEKTRQKVLSIAQELEYSPNNIGRYLKSGQTRTIGVLIPDIRNPIFPVIVRGIEDMARRLGYSIFLCNTDEMVSQQEHYVQLMRSMRVAGLIIATGQKRSDHTDISKFGGVPVVSIIRQIDGIDSVTVDNAGGIEQAMDHLLQSGRKRIVLCKGPSSIQPYKERFDAYVAKMKALSLYDPNLVVDVNPFNVGYGKDPFIDTDIAYEQLKTFFANGLEFDAVLAANDVVAMKCLRIMEELGKRVPADVAVIGFDNVDISTMTVPPLSTIGQPLYEVGKCAVKRLVNRIDNPSDEVALEKRFETTLILRKTT